MDEVCHAHQPRLADGRPRQLGRDHVADPARSRRRVPRRSTPSTAASSSHGLRRARRRRVRSGDASGRGHDPHRRARVGGSASRARGRRRRSSTLLERAVRAPRATRSRRRPSSCPCCATPASSTRAARASRCCSTRSLEVVDGRPIPEPERRHDARGRSTRTSRATTSPGCATRSCTSSTRRRRRSPAFRDAWGAIGDSIVVVGGDGLVELPHPHQRHRRRDRSRHRRRPAAQRSASPTCSSRSRKSAGCARPRSSPISPAAREPRRGHDRGRRGRCRRGRAPPAHEPRRAAGRRRRPVDEPVDGADPRSGRGVRRRRGRSCCRTTRTSSPVAQQVDELTDKRVAVVPTHERPRGARRARRLRPERRARRERGDDERRASSASAPARSRRPCATPPSTCGAITQGRLDRARRATGSSRATRVAVRRGVQAARQARRRRQRDRHRARRRPTRPRPRHRAHPRAHRVRVPARRGRVPRRRPAAVPVPRRRGVARSPRVPTGDPPLTLRDLRAIAVGAAEGCRRRRSRRASPTMGLRRRARPAAALPAPLGRPHEEGRHRRARRSARRRRCSPRCAAIHGRRTRQGRVARRGGRVTTARRCSTSRSSTRRGARSSSRSGTEASFFGKLDVYRGKRQMTNPVVDVLGRAGVADEKTGVIVPVYPQSGKAEVFTWQLRTLVGEALRRCTTARLRRSARRRDARPRTTSSTATPRTARSTGPTRWPSIARRGAPARSSTSSCACRSGSSRASARSRPSSRASATTSTARSSTRSSRSCRSRSPATSSARSTRSRATWRARRRCTACSRATSARARRSSRSRRCSIGGAGRLPGRVHGADRGARRAALPRLGAAARRAHRRRPRARCSRDRPVRVELLTNRTTAAERRRIAAGLASGEVDILVGTHALLYGDARVPRLGLAVIDEQHRFGVEQRALLRGQGRRSPTCS